MISRLLRPSSVGASALLLLALVWGPAGATRASRDAEASRLLDHATRLLGERTVETRHLAIENLERALELAPQRADVLIALARADYLAGFLKQSRLHFERAMAVAPGDVAARMGLGDAWRRDWLKYLEPRSLDLAVQHYSAACGLDSTRVDAWLLVSALEIERGHLDVARAAAERALRLDHMRPEPMLAAASTRWRQGDVEGSDSLFRSAFTRLRRSVRDRFEDFAPIASERDTSEYNHLSPARRSDFARRFWREHDPDLATPENEAQLEYWARVAQAYFLYYDPARRQWDERGEVYVRYGPPDSVQYNPVGTSLYGYRSGSEQVAFPINVLVWTYRSLGMSVSLHDRLLSERYELPVSMDTDNDPRPEPDSVANPGLVTTHELRGVFPALPPGTRPLAVSPQIATFEGDGREAKLFAAVSATGGPADTLVAEMVVLDSAMTEIARVRRPLSPSACEAATLRVADFDALLPPGDYRVGMSVRGRGRRGATRDAVHVDPPDSSLAMSDVVVTCGTPATREAGVRLDPNPAGNVRPGSPLVAYFEVYHVRPGADGQGRFEYETSVRSARRDPRIWLQRWLSPRHEGQDLGVTRQDAVLGTIRRQFVSMSVETLPPGRYRLDVTVRDVLTGDERRRSAEFTRE